MSWCWGSAYYWSEKDITWILTMNALGFYSVLDLFLIVYFWKTVKAAFSKFKIPSPEILLALVWRMSQRIRKYYHIMFKYIRYEFTFTNWHDKNHTVVQSTTGLPFTVTTTQSCVKRAPLSQVYVQQAQIKDFFSTGGTLVFKDAKSSLKPVIRVIKGWILQVASREHKLLITEDFFILPIA